MPSALSSNEILKELNISRSTFYYLLKHHLIELPTTSTGRYVWDEKSISQLKTMLKEAPADNTAASEPRRQIIRRLRNPPTRPPKSIIGVISATNTNCWILSSLR